MQTHIDLSKLISVKLDLSVVQESLSQTIKDIYSKIGQLQSCNQQYKKDHQQLSNETHKIYQLLQQSNQKHGHAIKQLQEQITRINSNQPVSQELNPICAVVEKTPKQVLDHIENRLQLNLSPTSGSKNIDLNCSPPKTERLIQTVRVKESTDSHLQQKELLDQKVYEFYEKTVEKIEAQITELRKDFRTQLKTLTEKSSTTEVIKAQPNQKNVTNNNKAKKAKGEPAKTKKKENSDQFDMGDIFGGSDPTQKNIAGNKSQKVVTISSKRIESTPFEIDPIQSQIDTDKEEAGQISPLQKIQIKQFLEELKKEVKAELQEVVKNAEQKFEEINRTNSVIADHLVQAKKSMEELVNEKDSVKIQLAGIREKNSTSERQICLLLDSSTDNKNKIKILQSSISKINEELKECKVGNQVIQQVNEDQNSSKKDLFRDSHSSFRSSIAGNLNPIRNNSILKMNNNKIQGIEETLKLMNNRMSSLVDRLNRMEDEKKKWELQQFGSSLPKIDKENKSNVNPIEIIKKQLKKVNDDIVKTNERLTATKDKLNELYDSHAEIPNKIEDIYIKLRENNQLQEDRLIELIKQLINRALTDPFDNNFTNRLKREINVKFLEIKHEYNCILKDIESKVENRAEINELQKVAHKFEQSVLQVKSIASKKCETEDFKKGIKYLQGKIKQVFQFAKSETVALANEQKQYIGAKKQQLH